MARGLATIEEGVLSPKKVEHIIPSKNSLLMKKSRLPK